MYKILFIIDIIAAVFFVLIIRNLTIALMFLLLFVFVQHTILFITKNYHRKRIMEFCDEHGFYYKASTDSLICCEESFEAYGNYGDVHEYSNEMYKVIDGYKVDIYEITLFDIENKGSRSSGLRPNVLKEVYSLCQVSKDDYLLPSFTLRDKIKYWDNLFAKINKDIIFEEDDRFSKLFFLEGRNEEEIRDIFEDKTRKAFLKYHKPGFKYEGKGHCLLIYCNGFASIKKRIVMMNAAINIFKSMESEDYTRKKRDANFMGKKYIPKKSPFEGLGL